MNFIKHSENIKTNRNIKSYRSCTNNTGISQKSLDYGRIGFEREKLAVKNERRIKITEQLALINKD